MQKLEIEMKNEEVLHILRELEDVVIRRDASSKRAKNLLDSKFSKKKYRHNKELLKFLLEE